MNHGTIGEEGCPCGEVITDNYRIVAHCWKSGSCQTHPYACVHYKAKRGHSKEARTHALELKKYITELWNCHCDVGVINQNQ